MQLLILKNHVYLDFPTEMIQYTGCIIQLKLAMHTQTSIQSMEL